MKNLFLLFVLGVFQLGAQQAAHPILKECETNADAKQCSSEKWIEFENELQATLEASSAYSIADSLYVKFRVSDKGRVKIEESFALVSELTLMTAEQALKEKGVQLTPTSKGEMYEWFWSFDIPDNFSSYKSFDSIDDYPEMIECKSFNSIGRRSCSDYILYKAKEEILDEGVNEHASFKVFFKEGKAVAIEAFDIPVSKTLADMVVISANQMMLKMATEGSRKRSDEFYTYIEIDFKGDSLKRWKKRMNRLDYLKSIKDPEPFLSEVLHIQSKVFYKQKDRGNRFLMGQLAEVEFDYKESFRVGPFVYSLDSIRNYKYVEKDTLDQEGNDVAMVEQKPLFKGCSEFMGDDEGAVKCFNQQVFKHVSKTFVFPETARKKGIQGKVYTSFIIEKDGQISNVSIVRGVHQLLDLECIRVISEIPEMDSPAMQRGKPVRMSFTMPINAKLQ